MTKKATIKSAAVPKKMEMMILSERVNLFINSPRINFLNYTVVDDL